MWKRENQVICGVFLEREGSKNMPQRRYLKEPKRSQKAPCWEKSKVQPCYQRIYTLYLPGDTNLVVSQVFQGPIKKRDITSDFHHGCLNERLSNSHGWNYAYLYSKLTTETLEQRCEICSKLTIKPPGVLFRRFIVNFEHISHLCFSVSIFNFGHVIVGWDSDDA